MVNKVFKTGIEYMFDLYKATSKPKFDKICLCPELAEYAKLIYEAYDNKITLIDSSGKLEKKHKVKKKVSVFSVTGGKDSTAVFLKNKNCKDTKDYGCHILNINLLYPSEKEKVESMASLLNLKVQFIESGLKNTKTFLPESVIKNQMIHALILEKIDFLPQYLGFGGTKNIGPQSMAFFHDHPKAFEAFHKFANSSWGNHEFLPFLEDEIESYQIINSSNISHLKEGLASCMTQQNKKRVMRESVQKKYEIMLANEYDCGKCYKCVEKAIIEEKYFGVAYPNRYLKFCRDIIIKKIEEVLTFNGYPSQLLKTRIPYHYLTRMGISKKEIKIPLRYLR